MVNLSTPSEQLLKELSQDFDKALYWHKKHYGGEKKYSQFQDSMLEKCMRTKETQTGETIEYKSPNGNRWITFESCQYYPDSKGAYTGMLAFCYYETYGSIGAFRVLNDVNGNPNGVIIFTSHFFERFCERLRINGVGRTRQIVKNLVEILPSMFVEFYPRSEKDGLIHIDIRVPGSLGRGVLREGSSIPVYEIRTFLADKQLNNKQKRETVHIRENADKSRGYEPDEMRNNRLLLETQRDGLETVVDREIENVTNMGIPREIAEKTAVAGISIMNAMIDDNLAGPHDYKFWTEHGKRNADIINDYAIKCYSEPTFHQGAELIKLAAECIKKDNLEKKAHMRVITKSILTKTLMVPEAKAEEMIRNLSDRV